ncbi:acyl-CoA dehydrogenase family protein [Streptomyces sp. NPDC002773]|uniref:acyl-CoA dehydrogenase family protein n=1 Tax=Streptomyces sp. NPDC002773 TaxID=3154430 RepID=UPI00332B520E
MTFAARPSEEQHELSSIVRNLLARRSDSVAVRAAAESELGYDPELWRTVCEQVGVAALAVPEEYGGAGFTLVETHVVLEELGAALTPSPLLGSGVLATQALLLSGDEAACHRLLPGLAEGTRTAAVCWAGEDGRWHTDRAAVRADAVDSHADAGTDAVDAAGGTEAGWALSGTATLVLDGVGADTLLVVAALGAGRVGLFEVDPGDAGVHRTATPAMDTTLRFARVEFAGARAVPVTLDAGALLPVLHDIAAVAVTALQVGAARRGLDMTVEYAGQREQFGRPIGSFQALKHRMADMLVAVETARSASWAAAQSAAHRTPRLPHDAALAKAWCSEALHHIASETVQLHGGIAITWEHDAQMVFKRAHATSQLFGQPHEHRRRLFRLLEQAADGRPAS